MRNSILITFIFFIFFSACKDDKIDLMQGDTKKESTIRPEKKGSVLNNNLEVTPQDPTILAIQAGVNQLVGSNIKDVDVYNLSSTQLNQLSAQLTSNSVAFLKNQYGYTNQELINIYGSVDNAEIGALAMVMTIVKELQPISGGNGFSLCNNQYKAVRCLVSSLGVPCTIITYVLNNMNGIGSSSLTRSQIANIIRESIYFGINVGGTITGVRMVMVAHDYAICMLMPTSNPNSENPNPDVPQPSDPNSPVGGNYSYFLIPDRVPGFCFTNDLITKYYTFGQLEQLTLNQFNNTNSIKLYPNSADWKFYQDPSFLIKAFDGVYYVNCGIYAYYEFVEIKDGKAVRMYGKYL